ncbi:MAG: GNAT family N-acetyltransferase [Thermoleophilia bacterium]|nr:GNAT family N-acetyltransferase [Thermoleophilia bacterium]
MLEVERNSPLEASALSEFFVRCGWQESGGAVTLEWALATSEEWIACRLDGELIGFGRSCRLDPMHRVVFDAVVDPRFEGTGLRAEIVRLLAETAGGLEVVSVFAAWHANPRAALAALEGDIGPGYFPPAPAEAYLGGKRISKDAEQ